MRRKTSRKKIILWRISILIIAFNISLVIFLSFKNGWDGVNRFTIVLQNIDKRNKATDYGLAVISVEPKMHQGVYLYLKPNFLMEAPYGYKTYPLYSIYKLGELDTLRGGGKLLKKAVESTIGIKTDRYLLFKNKEAMKLPDTREKLSEFKRDNFRLITGLPFIKTMITAGIVTDMSFWERLRFFWAVRNLRLDQMMYLDPTESAAGRKEELPDRTQIYTLDWELYDNFILNDFQDIRIREENFTIEVQNASGGEKIARQFARILNHMGAHVVFTTTAIETNKNYCQIKFYNAKARQSIIAQILKKDYNCREDNQNINQSAADIKVVIGEGFLK